MFLFWALALTEIIVGGEIDIFVPSFPEIQQAFSLDLFQVEFVLTANLIAYGLASFWAGEWGDRYGHKKIVVLGLIFFVIGSIICWFSPSLYVLLLGRVVQGVGIAAPAVLSYVWMMDVYPKERHIALTGLMNGIVTLAVSGAPILGSFITFYWGWRGNFSLLFWSGIVAWVLCQMCATPPRNKKKEITNKVSYSEIFRHKLAMYTMASSSCMALVYYVFVGISPVLYREALGVSLHEFGWHLAVMSVIFAFFSLLSNFFTKRWGMILCMKISIISFILFSVGLLVLVFYKITSPLWITAVLCLNAAACAVPSAILYPLGLNAIEGAKGRISAVHLASRLVLTAVGLQIASYIYDGTFAPIGILLFIMTGFIFLSLYLLYRYCDFQAIMRQNDAKG